MITQNKKLFLDTLVTTTHFLKKCVKVPKIPQNINKLQPNLLQSKSVMNSYE